MGRSGNTGFGVSNYFGLPNRKKKLLTLEFLEDFKKELISRAKENNKNRDLNVDYDNETYMSFYGQIEGTYLFYNALETVSKKHNLSKAIYEYAKNMAWYDSDYFDDDLVLEMVAKGVIEYDSDNYSSDTYEQELKAKYKLVEIFKGYNVVEYGYWFEDDKESLEKIYSDGKQKLIWLD